MCVTYCKLTIENAKQKCYNYFTTQVCKIVESFNLHSSINLWAHSFIHAY